MRRIWFLIIISFILLADTIYRVPTVSAQDGECDTAGLLVSIIEAASAATDADALDVLSDIGAQISHMRAACDGLRFEGSSEQVLGPVEIPEGIYRARVTTTGYFILHVVPLDGECGSGARMSQGSLFNLTEGDATNGAEAVFTSAGCEVLLEIANLSAPPYTLEFEKLR